MYTESFKEFVRQGVEAKYFIGTGNPNSNILLIGKESAISQDNQIGNLVYNDNANSWDKHVKNNTCEILEYPVDENNSLRTGWGRNTWSKYQFLSDVIWENNKRSYYIDFLKSAFTTEINDSPAKNTAIADKSGLNYRKQIFKDSEFIQSFPVVVLACSDYIKNNDEIREIDEIFDVTYDGHDTGRRVYNKGNWFFIHHNSDQSKLVIHTRQLSADVKNTMLTDMGKIIRNHLIDTGKI